MTSTLSTTTYSRYQSCNVYSVVVICRDKTPNATFCRSLNSVNIAIVAMMLTRNWPSRARTGPRTWASRSRTGPRTWLQGQWHVQYLSDRVPGNLILNSLKNHTQTLHDTITTLFRLPIFGGEKRPRLFYGIMLARLTIHRLAKFGRGSVCNTCFTYNEVLWLENRLRSKSFALNLGGSY